MDTVELGLTPLTCSEQAGFIWVGGDEMRQQGLWQAEDMHITLDPILHQPTTSNKTTTPPSAYNLIGYREWTIEANWQLLVETALESYHVPALHQKTFHLVTDPTEGTMVSEWKDRNRNVTMTVPLRNFHHDVVADDGTNNWTAQDTIRFLGETTTTHLIFPYSFVTLFKRFAVFITMTPYNPSPSSTTNIRAWALPHQWHDASLEGDKVQQRDFAAVLAAVEEDWDCTEQIQMGFNNFEGNQRNAPQFIYGGYEGNNILFLNTVGEVAKQLEEMAR